MLSSTDTLWRLLLVLLVPITLSILEFVQASPVLQMPLAVPTYAYSSVDFYSPIMGGGSMLNDGELSDALDTDPTLLI